MNEWKATRNEETRQVHDESVSIRNATAQVVQAHARQHDTRLKKERTMHINIRANPSLRCFFFDLFFSFCFLFLLSGDMTILLSCAIEGAKQQACQMRESNSSNDSQARSVKMIIPLEVVEALAPSARKLDP